MTEKRNALYAIPCTFRKPGKNGNETLFFLTFNTTDEAEAYKLASCVYGNKGKRALVIITEHGEIHHLQ